MLKILNELPLLIQYKSRIIKRCSSLVQTESGAAIINGKPAPPNLVEIRRRKPPKGNTVQNDSTATRNKNTTSLRVIINLRYKT